MAVNTIFVLVCGFIFYFILPFLIVGLIKNKKIKNIFIVIYLVLFLVVLFIGVFGKLDISLKNVIINLDFSSSWCNKPIRWAFENLTTFDVCINLFMLIPIGTVVAYFFKKKKFVVKLLLFALIGFVCGALIETLQFVLPVYRSVQLSDVVFNCISVVIGGILACVPFKFINRS